MTGILMLGGGVAANAQGVSDDLGSSANTAELQANMGSMGIDAETQDSLIADLEAGKMWDSLSGVEPVSKTSFEEAGFSQERRVYPDGSIGISEREIPVQAGDGVSTRAYGVSGCTAAGVAGETQYRGCLVKEMSGLITAEFEVSYLTGASRAYIMSTGDSRVSVYFGNYSNKAVTITQAEALIGVPASAQLSFQFQAGAVNSTGYVYFRVTQAGVASSSSAI